MGLDCGVGELAARRDASSCAAVVALDRALAVSPGIGLVEKVPALVSLLVDFDPLLTDHVQVQAHVQGLHRGRRHRRHHLACAGGRAAPHRPG